LVGVSSLLGTGAAAWEARVWRSRREGTWKNEPDAPEEISTRVRELTAALGCPVSRVLVLPTLGTGSAPLLQVRDGVAVVSQSLVGELPPGQVAAVVAARALAGPPGPGGARLRVRRPL